MGLTDQLTKGVAGALKGGVGLADKATGRAKQVAGGLIGRPDVRRQGLEEERKGEAKDELRAQQQRVAEEEQRADQLERAERDRAAARAQKEFARAERAIERKRETVEAEKARAGQKTRQVNALENATDPDKLVEASTRPELEKKARELGVAGRARMSKRELADEIVKRR